MSVFFKSKVFSFILPVFVLMIVPTLLLLWSVNLPLPFSANFHLWQIFPALFFALPGLWLFFSTVRLFHRKGGGTLAPWSPTKRLIAEGPYRYSRNPMITGVLFLLLAESVVFGSLMILIWALLFFILNTFYFRYSEEPGLFQRFGEDYLSYKKEVRMWFGRRRKE